MGKQVFIQQLNGVTEFAVLRDKLLIELHTEKNADELQEGDIFIGSVAKFLPGINSVFVDIGTNKHGFLHYSDLGSSILSMLDFSKRLLENKEEVDLSKFKLKPPTSKDGKINNTLKKKQILPVQILKEPISNKGARLTTDISLPGRFTVLIPFSDRGISISKKIFDQAERERLRKIAMRFIKPNFCLILRTAAQGIKEQDLKDDISNLFEEWNNLCGEMLSSPKLRKIHSENNRVISFLRDFLNDDFEQIIINTRSLYNEVKRYIERIDPQRINILQLADQPNLFDNSNITKQIKLAFSSKVPLENGGHLVIQQTEAMHVIDVNSGFKVFSENQEKNAFENNLLAVKEVARQIQLRDLGGIIVIDFIDLKDAEHRKKIYESMIEALSNDRSSHKILPLSKFGILQITRQRARPEVTINTSEICPSCRGTGKIDSHALIIEDEIQKTLDYLFSIGHKNVSIHSHPIVYAYLKKGGLKSILNRWRWKYKKWIRLEPSPSLQFVKYKIYDSKGEEIKLV